MRKHFHKVIIALVLIILMWQMVAPCFARDIVRSPSRGRVLGNRIYAPDPNSPEGERALDFRGAFDQAQAIGEQGPICFGFEITRHHEQLGFGQEHTGPLRVRPNVPSREVGFPFDLTQKTHPFQANPFLQAPLDTTASFVIPFENGVYGDVLVAEPADLRYMKSYALHGTDPRLQFDHLRLPNAAIDLNALEGYRPLHLSMLEHGAYLQNLSTPRVSEFNQHLQGRAVNEMPLALNRQFEDQTCFVDLSADADELIITVPINVHTFWAYPGDLNLEVPNFECVLKGIPQMDADRGIQSLEDYPILIEREDVNDNAPGGNHVFIFRLPLREDLENHIRTGIHYLFQISFIYNYERPFPELPNTTEGFSFTKNTYLRLCVRKQPAVVPFWPDSQSTAQSQSMDEGEDQEQRFDANGSPIPMRRPRPEAPGAPYFDRYAQQPGTPLEDNRSVDYLNDLMQAFGLADRFREREQALDEAVRTDDTFRRPATPEMAHEARPATPDAPHRRPTNPSGLGAPIPFDMDGDSSSSFFAGDEGSNSWLYAEGDPSRFFWASPVRDSFDDPAVAHLEEGVEGRHSPVPYADGGVDGMDSDDLDIDLSEFAFGSFEDEGDQSSFGDEGSDRSADHLDIRSGGDSVEATQDQSFLLTFDEPYSSGHSSMEVQGPAVARRRLEGDREQEVYGDAEEPHRH